MWLLEWSIFITFLFQRIKQTKTKKEGWDKRRKLFKLYSCNKACFLFPCLFIFHLLNLLNIIENVFCFHLLIYSDSFRFIIFKRLYDTSFMLNVVNFLRALPRRPLTEPIEELKVHPDPQLPFFLNQWKTENHFPSWPMPCLGIYPNNFTNVSFWTKIEFLNVLFHEKWSQNYCKIQVRIWMCLSSAVGLWWSPAWLQVVKPLEKFGPFTSGGQMNSLK